MGVYELSIKRPFTNFKRLLAGILWNILPILNFVAFGYTLRCAKLSMKNNFEMPAWDKKGELFINGLFSGIISLIYLIPTMVLFFVFFFKGIIQMERGVRKEEFLLELFKSMITNNLGLFLLMCLLFLLTIYIIPSAIMNFVNKNRFNGGFEFSTVFKKAFTRKYFVTFLVLNVVYSSILYLLLGFIPYIGTTIASFLIYVTNHSAYGAIYNKL